MKSAPEALSIINRMKKEGFISRAVLSVWAHWNMQHVSYLAQKHSIQERKTEIGPFFCVADIRNFLRRRIASDTLTIEVIGKSFPEV